MKYAILFLLTLSLSAAAQKKDSIVNLDPWQLEQLKKFDDTSREIDNAMQVNIVKKYQLDATSKDIETAAQVNESNRKTFFKALIGRDVTPQDSVTYDQGRIVIHKRKAKN